MSIVTINITGLAYCHPEWTNQASSIAKLHVLFIRPSDGRHKLKMDVRKYGVNPEDTQYYVDIPADTHIRVTNSGGTSQDPSPDPITDMLHMNDLHGAALPFLPLPPNYKVSYLTIPEAIVRTTAKTPKDIEIWKITDNAERTLWGTQKVGTHLGVQFELLTSSKIVFELSDRDATPPPPVQETGTYIFQPPFNYEITLDNTCPDDHCISDFRYYYQILDGKDTAGKLIEFDEQPVFEPLALALRPKDKEAACNPAIGDPPAGVPPCGLEEYYLTGPC